MKDDSTKAHECVFLPSAFLYELCALEILPENIDDQAMAEASQRMEAWQESLHMDHEMFTQRLASDNLTPEGFVNVLAHTALLSQSAAEQWTWTQILQEIMHGSYKHIFTPAIFIRIGVGQEERVQELPFASAITPFLQYALHHLRVRLDIQYTCHVWKEHIAEEAETGFLQGLVERLLKISARTLVLELNVARLLGRLSGDTPQQRFTYFSNVYFAQENRFAQWLREYPVLARLLVTTVLDWIDATYECIHRLITDWEVLQRMFAEGQELGKLIHARTGLSDLHRHGRSVIELRFASDRRIVYKPKSLDIDVQFQYLVGWLNTLGFPLTHRLIIILNCGSYGWVEFVQADACPDISAIERFYWRQGSYLALFYLIKATDFHFENLIASGEYPMMIDLEALFHHEVPANYTDTAYEQARKHLNQSVMRVGLLPILLRGQEGESSLDISGFGAMEGQWLPRPIQTFDAEYTDNMSIVYKRMQLKSGINRPYILNQPTDPTDFVDAIVSGFEATYLALMHHRDQFFTILSTFTDVEVRHIVRATRRYILLLQEATHPDYLRDGLERNRVLDQLWLEIRDQAHLEKVIQAEQRDLLFEDVPVFFSRPGSRHLWTSEGVCIQNFFAQDSLSEIAAHLDSLSPEDCRQQISFIRGAMIAIERTPNLLRYPVADQATKIQAVPSSEAFLMAATMIGEYVQARAIYGKQDVGWIGVGLEGNDHWRWILAPIDAYLYEGTGGMALFFGYLAAATGRDDFYELARRSVEPVRQQARSTEESAYINIGAFSGRASHLYVLNHLAALWQDSTLLEEALAGLPELARQVPFDTNFDVLSGCAGCAVVLLHLYRQTGSTAALDIAVQCGERLLATAQPFHNGIGWISPATHDALAGFSHGVAGIAWSLAELATATNDKRYLTAAMQGITYERSLFVPELGNWLDLRKFDNIMPAPPNAHMAAWCHGAPGVTLGRTLMLSHVDEPSLREEIAIGMSTTLRTDAEDNHSLCHGELGNLDILRYVGEKLGDRQCQQAVVQRSAQALRAIEARQWRCGLPRNVETVGLMLGMAGIGYGLLRCWSPTTIPCVLALDPST